MEADLRAAAAEAAAIGGCSDDVRSHRLRRSAPTDLDARVPAAPAEHRRRGWPRRAAEGLCEPCVHSLAPPEDGGRKTVYVSSMCAPYPIYPYQTRDAG